MAQPDNGSPEFWAARRPDALAVIHGGTALTYRQWNDAADRVAERLAQLGLISGDRIGMRFRLSLEWFVIQRALQKLGVAQVAAEVGYESEAAFNRAFKKSVGVPPGAWRRGRQTSLSA